MLGISQNRRTSMAVFNRPQTQPNRAMNFNREPLQKVLVDINPKSQPEWFPCMARVGSLPCFHSSAHFSWLQFLGASQFLGSSVMLASRLCCTVRAERAVQREQILCIAQPKYKTRNRRVPNLKFIPHMRHQALSPMSPTWVCLCWSWYPLLGL